MNLFSCPAVQHAVIGGNVVAGDCCVLTTVTEESVIRLTGIRLTAEGFQRTIRPLSLAGSVAACLHSYMCCAALEAWWKH